MNKKIHVPIIFLVEPTTVKTTTKPPVVGETVYLCDFDDGENCDVTFVGAETEMIVEFTKKLEVSGKVYRDHSAISKLRVFK